MYICLNCRKEVEVKNANEQFLCPHCSGKILFKEAGTKIKKIKAR